jgi:hypothetical protein
MNATGVKHNDQELRNAKYYGEFKTSMYKIASEQLNKWRIWKIFTENNIARMEEVEITSEFALLMLKGLTGKTQASISKIYNDKDAEYPECSEVERRFRITMDTIDDTLGTELKYLPFSKKTLFYTLFAFMYYCQFGSKSPTEKVSAKTISNDIVAKIKLLGKRLNDKTAPEGILEAATRRTTNLNSRQALFNYLIKETKID